jgi:iron(III) transport system substrate-binding protein
MHISARGESPATGQVALAAGLIAAAVALGGAVSAQVKPGATSADVALYEGADRLQKIVVGAKKEGVLSIYTSAQSDDLGPVVAAFERKYGIKVSVWRASAEDVLERTVQESRGNRFTVDIVETNGPQLESLHREEILQRVKSPYLQDLIAPAIRPHGEWAGTRLDVYVQAYNTRLVKKEDLPRTWEELADPKWKGKLGIEQEDTDWLAGVCSDIGEARAMKVFRDIVAANHISTRQGHTLLTQLVAAGEVPLALTVYAYKAEQLKAQGEPIDWFVIGNAIARPNGVAVARRAPDPHAAVLFYDFELSDEGQKLLAARDFVPATTRIDTPLDRVPMTFIDPRATLDEYDKWTALAEELFGGRDR